MKTSQISIRAIDHGIGVLRGVLSRADIALAAPGDVELAIEHIRAAARLVERLERQIRKQRSARVHEHLRHALGSAIDDGPPPRQAMGGDRGAHVGDIYPAEQKLSTAASK